jgi:hypothetical protein
MMMNMFRISTLFFITHAVPTTKLIFLLLLYDAAALKHDKRVRKKLFYKQNQIETDYINPFFLVLSHMFGYVEQKLSGRSPRKGLVFLKSNFFRQ